MKTIMIFILPPSIDELKRRLINRKTESDSDLQKRFERAKMEIDFQSHFEHRIVNDDLENARVPDVKGVWISDFAGQQFIVVSIKQRYGGHASQAAFAASQGSIVGAYHGRYVIVVDDDIYHI